MIPRPRCPNTRRCGPGSGECGGAAVLIEFLARVLRSAVGMEYHAGRRVTPTTGHLEGIDDQAGAHVIGDRPTNDGTRVQVDHRRQVRPTGPRPDVGDVTAPGDLGAAAVNRRPMRSGVLSRYPAVRPAGVHCFQWYAGELSNGSRRTSGSTSSPIGSSRTGIARDQGLGLDRFPWLKETYFGNLTSRAVRAAAPRSRSRGEARRRSPSGWSGRWRSTTSASPRSRTC